MTQRNIFLGGSLGLSEFWPSTLSNRVMVVATIMFLLLAVAMIMVFVAGGCYDYGHFDGGCYEYGWR